ncbi:DUF4179 domain-containing protein [Paenibacillus guangzhouensis]|uniref:DUF4179 domain-containing protein n=1 Tax=Paenibacillus guangzhouensis TaxID=1473112 RepID=UPI0012676B0E|nr:DUF4179 domain-containing protein [Paenibacillus guangzhouensis]
MMKNTSLTLFTKTIAATCAAALLGTGVITGSALTATSVAAAQAANDNVFKQWGDAGLKAADKQGMTTVKDVSLTQNGVTLGVSELMYDGIRLVMVLKVKGTTAKNVSFPTYLVDGQPLDRSITSSMMTVPKSAGESDDTLLIQFTDMIDQGTGANLLPDEFELTLQTEVNDVKDAFTLPIPVKNIAKKRIALQPKITKTEQKFSSSVLSLAMTSTTTLMEVKSVGPIPSNAKIPKGNTATKMYYDIADDRGEMLQPIKIDIFNGKPLNEYQDKIVYPPVLSGAKFITVKPYTYSMDKKGKIMTDAKGKWVKFYHKALEMKIPVKA